ncbi:piggyBac transposable element-derived 3-like protein [Labeo rohita]|uniref:PiggyBac transposable element-derived 3-like protein n=1 Tax=Labeo rohita TaxID=84645 RepID=A0A498NWX1_LABRO|nr:piggyBac transposable element-derived 3-like protein [Labeo rohita]RXN36186.1 piggyBac transposable element-derived 3-like protein [Labeo rohita]
MAVFTHLCQRIQAPNHKIYFDNYFTTCNLLEALAEKKIHAAGTARVCRFANPPLKPDKEMSKKERGNHDEVQSRDGKVVLVKCVDNCSVVLASNFVGVGDEDEVQRWDQKEKQYVKIKHPEVVKKYNKAMGGVDKLDQLISLYRIDIRSRKWPLCMIFHVIDVDVVNSWLEYRRDIESKGTQPQKIMDLLEFKMKVAEVLVCAGKPQG